MGIQTTLGILKISIRGQIRAYLSTKLYYDNEGKQREAIKDFPKL